MRVLPAAVVLGACFAGLQWPELVPGQARFLRSHSWYRRATA